MKQLLQKLKRQPKQNEVVDTLLLNEEEVRKSLFDSAIKKTLAEEKIRFTTNFKIATTTTYLSLYLIMPFGFISWLMNLFGFVKVSPINILPWWFVIVLWVWPYLSWQYTTITIPQKEGPVIKRDWSKTAKGRKKAAIYNLLPFHIMSWAVFSKYVYHEYFDYLTTLNVSGVYKEILVTDNLNSFLLLLFVTPVIISGFAVFVQIRDYMINKDLLEEHFLQWQMPIAKRFAHEYKLESVDVIVGYELDTKKPIVIKENERFLHEAIIGATGSGKTSTTLLLRIAQDLIKIATDVKDMGLVLLEPKGDAVDDVLTLCKKLGIPDEKIIVIDPFKEMSYKYNPFIGERSVVANTFQGTISALTGDQDQFFKDQQNEMCKQITLLAKIRYDNKTNIRTIQQLIDDPRELANVVEHVSAFIEQNRRNAKITPLELKELDSYQVIVDYFLNQVLDYKTYRDKEEIKPVIYPPNHRHHPEQMVENKKENYISGAKKYLNDLVNEDSLRALFTSGDNDRVFDADKFLTEGGVVLVNTALGELDELSMMFGQFFIRQFQAAVFRRAKENKEEDIKRIPCIFYVDEFPLYANEAFERFLTLGRSYKVGAVIAMQSIAQLDAVGTDYRKTVMANASHKTVFGRGPVDDNEYFSKEFGEAIQVEESVNETGAPMTTDNQSWSFRMNSQKKEMPRFSPTDIRELPFKQMIVQIVDESNSLAPPKHAIGEFVHESAFVQRFMKLVESDIKSTVEKEINIVSAIKSTRDYTGNLSAGIFDDEKPEKEQALNEFVSEPAVVEGVKDVEAIDTSLNEHTESAFVMDPVLVSATEPQQQTIRNVQESIEDVFGGAEFSINDFASPAEIVTKEDVFASEPVAAEFVPPQSSLVNEQVTLSNNDVVITTDVVTNTNDNWFDLLEDEEVQKLAPQHEVTDIPSTDVQPVPAYEETNLNVGMEPTESVNVIVNDEVPIYEETNLNVGMEPTESVNVIVNDEVPVYEETNLNIGNEPTESTNIIVNDEVPVYEETNLNVGMEPTESTNIIVNDEVPVYEETNLNVGMEPTESTNIVNDEVPVYEETNLNIGIEPIINEAVSVIERPYVEPTDISNRLSAVSQEPVLENEPIISSEPLLSVNNEAPSITALEGLNHGMNSSVFNEPASKSIINEQDPLPQDFETSIIDSKSSVMFDKLQQEVIAAANNELHSKQSNSGTKSTKSDANKYAAVEKPAIELEI